MTVMLPGGCAALVSPPAGVVYEWYGTDKPPEGSVAYELWIDAGGGPLAVYVLCRGATAGDRDRMTGVQAAAALAASASYMRPKYLRGHLIVSGDPGDRMLSTDGTEVLVKRLRDHYKSVREADSLARKARRHVRS